MDIGRKWVSPPYNVDGWRLDVAADLGCSNEYNHMFWKRFRKEVKEANPDALILAEHYGDPIEWLQGDEWDSVMNYDAFMEPLTWFLTGMEKHSDERRTDLWGNPDNFVGAMRHFMSSMLTPVASGGYERSCPIMITRGSLRAPIILWGVRNTWEPKRLKRESTTRLCARP